MAQVDITTVNGNLVIEWLGGQNLRKMTFASPSISTAPPEKVYFYEDGTYKTALYYSQINEIDGVAPTDYEDAVSKIEALLPSAGGGGTGGTNYNTETAYDQDATLPIAFTQGTIHAYSILCLTGTLTVTIAGEETVFVAGQSTSVEYSTLNGEEISIDSATGNFLVTTIS
jgi:hypothetical protein